MTDALRDEFLWPSGGIVRQARKDLYKADTFLDGVENLVGQHRAWAPVVGETKRTETPNKLSTWIGEQNRHADRIDELKGLEPSARLDAATFPVDPVTGSRVITTAKRIVYLIDDTRSVTRVFRAAWGPRESVESLDQDLSTLLFITNSVTSQGRAIAGDPFTGQLASFVKIFATDVDNVPTHNVVVYYPHQLYSQLFDARGSIRSSKGARLIRAVVDRLIFAGGVVITPLTWDVEA